MGNGTSGRSPLVCTTTNAHGSFPARAVHLIDIENLAGAGLPARWEVHRVHDALAKRIGFGAMDQIIVGCNHLALINAWRGWPSARFVVRSGPDCADLELLDVIKYENVAARFPSITIGSGDGAFAPAAAALAAAGCGVTVASRSGSLSRRLALAAQRIVYLDDEDITPAPSSSLPLAA